MSAPADPLAEQLGSRPAWQVVSLAAGIVLLSLLAIVLAVEAAGLTAPYSPLGGRLHRAGVGLLVVVVIYEAARRLSGAPPRWFLANRPSRWFLGWFLVGLALPSTILGLQLWLLDARLVGGLPTMDAAVGAFGVSLAAGLFAGVLEELAFRGALLRVLEARWDSRTAVAATAAVFAMLHQGHASGGTELLLVLASMLSAGLLLGTVVARTRSVWNAVVLHAGWNTVFGGTLVAAAPTTRLLDPAPVRYLLPRASVWLTGGGATLGATPLTTLCLLAATVSIALGRDRWLTAVREHASVKPRRDR
ncbi:MAG: lysostaphin resistance A-like protein [Halobacteriales archaeon]